MYLIYEATTIQHLIIADTLYMSNSHNNSSISFLYNSRSLFISCEREYLHETYYTYCCVFDYI
jgi:hypothetical protein